MTGLGRSRLRYAGAAAVGVLAWAVPVSEAQIGRLTGPEIDRLLRERALPGRQARQTEQARRLGRLLGRDVTYAEVLKDPDNVLLNLAFARTQIRNGNVKDAAATLERLRLVAPGSIAVRVLYAIVLFRLDNRSEAERELKALLRFKLTPDLRADIESYLREIDLRNRRTRFQILVHSSVQYQTNRNAAASANAVEGQGGLVPLRGEDQRIGDFAIRGLVKFSVEHDLKLARRHRLFGEISLYDSEQLRLDRLTLRATDAAGGIMLDLAPVELYLTAFGNFVQLSHQPYLVSGGAEVRPEWRVNRFNWLVGSFRVTYQDFWELSETFDQQVRGGPQFRWGVEWRRILSTRSRINVGAAFTRKLARRRFQQYNDYSAWAGYSFFFRNGSVLTNSVTYVRSQYDSPNIFESPKTRRVDYVIAGTTLAVPLSAIVPRLRSVKALRNTALSGSVEYERAVSNVTNYSFANWRFTFGITKTFDF